MVAYFIQLYDVFRLISRRKYMIFLSHFLFSKSGFKQPAGCGSPQIFSNHRVKAKHGKCLLCKKNPASGLFLHFFQYFKIFSYLFFIHNITGGFYLFKHIFSAFYYFCKFLIQKFSWEHETLAFGTLVSYHSTVAGFSSTTQGSPYLFNISMYGSGSNSSTLKTPGFFHAPVRTSAVPIIAGTPVV